MFDQIFLGILLFFLLPQEYTLTNKTIGLIKFTYV